MSVVSSGEKTNTPKSDARAASIIAESVLLPTGSAYFQTVHSASSLSAEWIAFATSNPSFEDPIKSFGFMGKSFGQHKRNKASCCVSSPGYTRIDDLRVI